MNPDECAPRENYLTNSLTFRYHCYTADPNTSGRILSSNVDAASATQAAEMAAAEHGQAGGWTVIRVAGNDVVKIAVRENKSYSGRII